MRLFRSGHARGDRRQHQNAFESFAKNEDADIEKRNRRARVRLRWIRRAVRGDSLPDQHGYDEYCGRTNRDCNRNAQRSAR